jgi:succinate-acetate transporter protein
MAEGPIIEQIQERPQKEIWTPAGPVVTRLSEYEALDLESRATVAVGDSTALGLWGFATGTWMAGTVIGGAFPPSASISLIAVLLVFAGVGQFIAGLIAFNRANTLAGTAFCCFGAFNVTVAITFLFEAQGIVPGTGAPQVLLGFLFESFAFIAIVLTVAALSVNWGLVVVLATLAAGYLLSGIPYLAQHTAGGYAIVGNIGGWFLVASAFFAYYVGSAMVVNSSRGREVLPLGGRQG